MILVNLERRITAAAIQVRQAKALGLSNTAKSSYYRSAILIICSCVEGVVYQIVKNNTQNINNIIDSTKELKEIHQIPSSILKTQNPVFMCEKITKDLHIDDKAAHFGKLNLFLKHRKLITNKEYKMIESVRKERNKIHLQGLKFNDIGYTAMKLEKMSKPLVFLIPKI